MLLVELEKGEPLMVNVGKGRLYRTNEGKCLIYLPKNFAEDSMFPFKAQDSYVVKITFEQGVDKLLIEKSEETKTEQKT